MVTVVSKLLLLVAVLASIENAASSANENSRRLSFFHPEVPDSNDVEESEGITSYSSKSGKGSKGGTIMISKKSGKKSEKTKGNSSPSKGGSKGSGKSMKSDRKVLHPDNDYEAKYEVVINYDKSKSSKKGIPDYEYIDAGYKSWKSSKAATESEDGDGSYVQRKSAKASFNGSGGLKSGKADAEGDGQSKSAKASYNGSEGLKSAKSSKGKSSRLVWVTIFGFIKFLLTFGRFFAPPICVASAPSMDPGTPYPTMVGSFGIGVPLYSLGYALLSKKEPTAEEFSELQDATKSYLNDFFFDEFAEDDFTLFDQFLTDIDDYSATTNMPVYVTYDSVVRFDQLSLIKPMPEQLGSAVEEAFTGLRMIQYENWLKEMLPSDNVFVGSKVQYYQGGIPSASRRLIGVTGIAAAAAAVTLLVAGVALYKSKGSAQGSESDKLTKAPGDMTVAGETFGGETYDGTVSVSAVSVDYARRSNDEEEGARTGSLGSNPESQDAGSDKIQDKGRIFRLAPSKIFSAFRNSVTSAPRTPSFEDVALQAPTSGARYEDNIMPDPSTSEDEASIMSDSELSQFVASAKQISNQASGGHTLEIKSLLSQDSMDENTADDLSVRDNSSRRLRTVAEIEALLSSELKDENSNSGSRSSRSIIQKEQQTSRPRTVEEIESLLTADDDDSFVELPYDSDEEETVVE